MADNVAITAGTGTSIATDQVGSDHYQLIKVAFGVLDTATLVSSSNGLPVNVLNASLAVTGTFFQATQPVSIASAVGVTGTFFQVTQPVSLASSVAVTQSGTWNVGTVTTVTGVTTVSTVTTVAAVTAITNALPAGTNLLGRTSASNETSAVYSGTTALTPKFATIAASSSGSNAIVALVSGKKIRVIRWNASSNGSVNMKWQSSATDITGLFYTTQFASAGGAYCPVGIFETASGEALNLNLSAAVAVGGVLTYLEV